jgi:lycopene beta-cyclase
LRTGAGGQIERQARTDTAAGRFDVIIVGGGLAGGLTALKLRMVRPDLDVCLIERGDRLGGNHTWCFFDTDLDAEKRAFLGPLVVRRWPRYHVRFPGYDRVLETGYGAVQSARFHEMLSAQLDGAVRLGQDVAHVGEGHVTLADGTILQAGCVIDARGQRPSPHLRLAYQKFVALELALVGPSGIETPIIMDARVSQLDGYRFLYSLPFSADRVLVYDTYYSDGPDVAVDVLHERIRIYAAAQGWQIGGIVREEKGVLPLILAADHRGLMAEAAEGPARIGLAAGLFHPVTGYSLPDAVRMADRIGTLAAARERPLTTASVRSTVAAYAGTIHRERSFLRLLNRMLFKAGQPQERFTVLGRFYRLDRDLIERFYAAALRPSDKLRIVLGKPPVPILSALRCVSERRALDDAGPARARGGDA